MISENNTILLVVPAHNEAAVLEANIKTLHEAMLRFAPAPWLILISENASADRTREVAERLVREMSHVAVLTSVAPGKGNAIRSAWKSRQAEWYGFIDADISVDFNEALPKIINALNKGVDIVTASRHLASSVVKRPLYRRLISRAYRGLIRIFIGTTLTDLACGCKFISRRVVEQVLPQVQNDQWFFDSELVLLGEARGYTVEEVGVRWTEFHHPERQSHVPLIRVSLQYIIALWQLRPRLKKPQ